MNQRKLLLIASVIFLIQINQLYSQGCSDAGFCTINNLKPDVDINQSSNNFKIGMSYGVADNSISTIGNYLEYNRRLNQTIDLNIKLTSLLQSGNSISQFDLSDLFISTSFKTEKHISFTAGLKIPLNKADKTKNSLPLPMDYQSSLGTFDLIFVLGLSINNLQISAASQIPLNQNENIFVAENYPPNSALREFQTTKNFKRSLDILLRITYPIVYNKNYKVLLSLLPIYHLANDKFTNSLGIEKEINGSKGLTLNGNVYFYYHINKTNSVMLNIGVPFIVRDSRPDGLTRSFISTVEYSYSF